MPPEEAADIAVGDAVSVVPLGASAPLAAQVVSRSAIIDAGSGLVAIRIALDGPALTAGQSARATVTVGRVKGYIVPHSAVLLDDTGNSYVVQAIGGIAHVVHVRVLAQQDDQSAIDGPLQADAPW